MSEHFDALRFLNASSKCWNPVYLKLRQQMLVNVNWLVESWELPPSVAKDICQRDNWDIIASVKKQTGNAVLWWW